MKIDVSTPSDIKHLADMTQSLTKTLYQEMEKLKNLVFELQDRIKILESKK